MTLTLNVSQPELYQQARRLWLFGLLKRWEDVVQEPWLKPLLDHEMEERRQRGLQRRIRNAKLGDFKPMADFQWDWPARVDRQLLDEIFTFQFVADAANVVLVGANGLGKTMIAQNLAHQAVLRGLNVIFTTASALLNDLAAQEGTTALARRLRYYCNPHLLVIDEVGYLSYDNRHADLLFEVVNQRYRKRALVLTTNKPFGEWADIFPNAASVVTLIDRLVHRAEIVQLEGESFRLKEANERAARRAGKPPPGRKTKPQ
jgi:DNA replication protein DnaC